MILQITMVNPDEDTVDKIVRVQERLQGAGYNVTIQRLGIDREWDGATAPDAGDELPIVYYSLGTKTRKCFRGSFTVVSYLWQAVRLLEGATKNAPKRRKRRGWQEYEDIKKREEEVKNEN